MASRGRELEGAIRRAAVQYRKEGRALLVQQFPRTASGPSGTVVYAGQAPADFIGAIGDSAAMVEAKEHTGRSLPLSMFDDGQRSALDAFEEYGFDCRVLVDFLDLKEVYMVRWFQVAAFIIAPWRKSLSLTWFRAHGQLVPELGRGDSAAGNARKAMFLEAGAHPQADICMLEIWNEQRSKPIISLDGPDLESTPASEPKPSPYAGLSPEQIRQRLLEAVQAGADSAAKRASKTRKWARRRAG